MHIEDFVLFGLLIAAGIVAVLMFFQLIAVLFGANSQTRVGFPLLWGVE
jgi:hypothetical protein